MSRRRSLVSLLASLLLSAVFCWAQRPTNPNVPPRLRYSIAGTVRYAANNRGAEMVRVELKSPTGGTIRIVVTNSNGDFEFTGLSADSYIIAVEETGYEEIRENVILHNGPQAGILLLLKSKNTVSTRTPETGGTISAREMTIPEDARKAYQKGSEKLARGDAAGSLALLSRAIARFPSYYEAYYQIGRAQIMLGRTEEGERAFRKCIEASGGRCAAGHFALGSLFSDNRKFVEAEAIILNGLQVDSTSWQGHFQLARALLGLNHLEEAEQRAQLAVEGNPSFPSAYLLLANIHLHRRDYPALKNDLDKYIRLEPNGPVSVQARQMREALERDLAKAQDPSPSPPVKP